MLHSFLMFWRLDRSLFWGVFFRVALSAGVIGGFQSSVRGQIRTALGVRSLTFAEADSRRDVDITGIVIFSDPSGTAFVQDQTAGTFFQFGTAVPPQPGDEVRVKGSTFPGLYLPGIEGAVFEVIRHPGLPAARDVSYEELNSGRFHYQRVAIKGIVRTVSPDTDEEGTSLVGIAMGTRVIEVRVEKPPPATSRLTDSLVRVSGLAAGRINTRRQLVAPYLRSPDWSEFEVIEEAPEVSAVPMLTAKELLNFEVTGKGRHRVRLKGTVLAVFSGGELFLRDVDAAIRAKLQHLEVPLHVGDSVEIIGFPEMEQFSASLVDAALLGRELGKTSPSPIKVSISDLMKGQLDGNLVSVVANLSDWYRTEKGGTLLLQEENQSIQADTPVLPDTLATDAQLMVTGVCQVRSSRGSHYNSKPERVSLRLRSGGDLALLKPPAWWTSQRLAALLFVLILAMLLATLWIALLRRQVNRQTLALRHRIESEAALEERHRIAREFHDTLEQEMVGLSLRLDAAVVRCVDAKMQGLLDGSRGLVSRIQTETRNLVSDLRDYPGEQVDLKIALQELVQQQPSGIGPVIELDFPVPSGLAKLPSRSVHHLTMIAREALANALKHAGAARIGIGVTIPEDDVLLMQISDDGRGFDVDAKTRGMAGHFGCVGIQERCGNIGATAVWESELEKGTLVTIRVLLTKR